MKYREFSCIVCGRKIIDRTTNHTKKYCSPDCASHGYLMRHGLLAKENTRPCMHNKQVVCEVHKCSTCGWNPEVEQRRKEAFAYG